MCSSADWLSFRRIVDVPFEACVTALGSRLRGPIGWDPDSGTCRIDVALAQGRLRPPLRMTLEVDRWSTSPPSTALELVPRQRVRAAPRYFRAGHRLLDSLISSLRPGQAARP
jgi:hypothetical protein